MPAAEPADKRVPVTVLTGFLGSGKTTLLNHILTVQHGLKLAVIENEFGEVGIDDHLIKKRKYQAEEEVIEMMNGCICCTVRADLITVVKKILDRKGPKLDGIIIETTGLADPAPVAQTFFVDEDIQKLARLDGIITLVDAKHIIPRLDEIKPEGVENESVEQLAFADRILLNKIDLVTEEEKAIVKTRVRAINGAAEIIECQQSKVDPKLLLNIQGFSLDRVLEFDPEFLGEDQEHQHDQSVTSVGFIIGDSDPLNVGMLQEWISELLQTKGTDLLRYKGVINCKGMEQRFVFQGVHMIFSGGFTTDWQPEENRESRFIFIGKNLDKQELTDKFMACVAAKTLRFKAGDAIMARRSKGFAAGTVLKCWDEGNPYRVKLNDRAGTEVWAPEDSDVYIKAAPSPVS